MDHAGEHFEEGKEAPPRGVHTMAIARWALIGLMAVAAVASVVHYFGWFPRSSASASSTQYYCPMHPSIVQDHPGECPICSMTLVPKPTSGAGGNTAPSMQGAPTPSTQPDGGTQSGAYYCPMHPNQTSNDANARCPECGMKMEPRPGAMTAPDAGAPPREGTIPGVGPVDLPPERIQLLGMRTAQATRQKLVPELRTVAYVAASEKGLAQIHTRFAGWIEHLNINQTGERVQRGQVLASIYSPELLNAQQEFLNAHRWSRERSDGASVADSAVAGLAADSRRRLELLGISRTEIDQLEKTGQPVRALAVRSPVSGYVIAKNALKGLYVDPSAVLFEIADLSTVWVLADVYEYQAERVRVGQRATLDLVALPGRTFTGRVQFMYPVVDSNTRTLRVRLEFGNSGLALRPGMYGNVHLQLASRIGLVVPSEAVVDTGEVQYVFVALGGGRFEPRRVRLGERSGDTVQVLDGIEEGETVVTTANFLLDSESRLRAAIEGASKSTASSGGTGEGSACDTEFDKNKYPEKYAQCRACEVQHRGMGSMEDDCKQAIAKPWK
jgi:Cu(I)/Ag(I) efflux system membrane fusion protein